jgi:hypothetical protein
MPGRRRLFWAEIYEGRDAQNMAIWKVNVRRISR